MPFHVRPGYDHEALNVGLEVALAPVVVWLAEQAVVTGLSVPADGTPRNVV